ncbi:serine/threonine protein kinase [Bradymonadaceae bacterium TMQ3]|nr:serine/threonine protein kinase [Bradymonadaceae bacterium TMQ3]TXC78228.1 serine/threonine protein kinase [Bradymonadales bacterium TMQ1]
MKELHRVEQVGLDACLHVLVGAKFDMVAFSIGDIRTAHTSLSVLKKGQGPRPQARLRDPKAHRAQTCTPVLVLSSAAGVNAVIDALQAPSLYSGTDRAVNFTRMDRMSNLSSVPASLAGRPPRKLLRRAQVLALERPLLFGKYTLLERVSVGGMAEVFRAKPLGAPDPNRYFALKRILPHLAEDEDFIRMFIDEARLTVQLRHPNVVQNFELGKFQSSFYILMEFVAGQDLLALQKLVRRQNTILSVDMACHILHEIACGMDYVHRKTDENGNPLNIIHRDISPQNVLVSWDGQVKVIDFGIAKAASQSTRTQVGVLKGKFGYMSPDQVRGYDIDHRSDIFAMGTLFWELLTNQRLFRGESQIETMRLIRDPQIESPRLFNPGVPEQVEAIVMRALAADREDRYQWAGEMAADLKAYLTRQKPPYHRSQLTTWMRSAFVEEYDAEKQKREHFRRINTADDVRQLFSQSYGPGGNDGDVELEEATQIWDVDEAPDEGVDLDAFVANHTVVQAGGLELSDYEAWADAPDTIDETRDEVEARLDEVLSAEPTGRHTAASPRPALRAMFDAEATDVTGVANPQRALALIQNTGTRETPSLAAAAPESPPAGLDAGTRRRIIAAFVTVLAVALLGAAALYLMMRKPPEPVAPPAATLNVQAAPAQGVSVWIDGVERAQGSPAIITDLAPGTYAVELRHPDYEPLVQSIQIRAEEHAEIRADLAADVEVQLSWPQVEGLRVFVNTQEVSVRERSDALLGLPRGRHLVEALAPDHRPFSRFIHAELGVDNSVAIALEPSDRLLIAGESAHEVMLNERSYGPPPVVLTDLRPQQVYTLELGTFKSAIGFPELGLGRVESDAVHELPVRSPDDYGWLSVSTGEDWWGVFIDDINTGLVTPIEGDTRIPVAAGQRTLSFRRGDRQVDFNIEVRAGEGTGFRRDLRFEP